MKLWDCIVTAVRALTSNKLRSILTMLGILIGVAAVISVVSLGQAQEAEVEEAFASMGSNLMYVIPGAESATGNRGPTGGTFLTMEDAEAIARDAPSVAMVAPFMQTTAQVATGGEDMMTTVRGVTPEAQAVNNLELAGGSFISEYDDKGRSRVVVLGSEVAETLFAQMDPVGQSIRINGRQFRVVGALESKGTGFGEDDLTAYTPLSTFQSVLVGKVATGRGTMIHAIMVQAASKEEIASAESEIAEILRDRHRLREAEENDFQIITMDSIAGQMGQILGVLQLILAAIAAISLLVGGIGIMNIMLVSVTERIREIGLRKAVGAKRRDISIQFLTEAAILSLCGGAVGVGLGWIIIRFASFLATRAGFPIGSMLSGGVILLALGVSIGIGLVSGVYPALRAARLDPIESLRHE